MIRVALLASALLFAAPAVAQGFGGGGGPQGGNNGPGPGSGPGGGFGGDDGLGGDGPDGDGVRGGGGRGETLPRLRRRALRGAPVHYFSYSETTPMWTIETPVTGFGNEALWEDVDPHVASGRVVARPSTDRIAAR